MDYKQVTWEIILLELELNVKWDGTITLRVTQWVHFVLGVWIVTGTQACR